MASRCLIQQTTDGVTIQLRPERSVLDALVWPVTVVVMSVVAVSIGWAGLVIWIVLIYLAWRFLWNLFGFEEITATPEKLMIRKRLLFWCRTQNYSERDIEWIAYHPQAYRSPAGIGILVKQHVMPIQIGFDLGAADAEALLQGLKAAVPWLGSRVRGISETSFYKLA